MVPGCDGSHEDLGQQAGIHGHGHPLDVEEDADGAQAERDVNHLLPCRQQVEVGLAHRNVSTSEVVVGLVTVACLTDELLLPSSASDGSVGEEQGCPSTPLHEFHGLRKPRPGIGRAAAMQGDDAVVIQRALERHQFRLQGLHRRLQLTDRPHRIAVTLGADDIVTRAGPGCSAVFEGEGGHRSRLGHGGPDIRAPLVHGRGDGIEIVRRQHSLSLYPCDEVHKGLQDTCHVSTHGADVLVQVHVGDEDDRPGVGAGLVEKRNSTPVRVRIYWNAACGHGSCACSSNSVVAVGVTGRDCILRGEPGVVLIHQAHLLELAEVAMPGIQVADGILVVGNMGLHARRALHFREGSRCGENGRTGGAQAPAGGAFLIQISGQAACAAGAEGPVAHLDLGACRHAQVGVLGQDQGIVPGSDHVAVDFGQKAGRQLEAASSNFCNWDGVEHTDGAQAERHVHHGAPGCSKGVEACLSHRDISRAEVGE
mmetsp:Transcript_29284/g.52406  ORF Transcript_29284/g.52406 Transcript_29284/m.52406 type:complete len:482 (-) Transcript_29284:319-1764(-)